MIVIMSDVLIEGLWKLTERKQEFATGAVLLRAGHPVRSLFLVVPVLYGSVEHYLTALS